MSLALQCYVGSLFNSAGEWLGMVFICKTHVGFGHCRVQSPLHLLPNSCLKDGHEEKSRDPTVLVILIGLLQLEVILHMAKTLRYVYSVMLFSML